MKTLLQEMATGYQPTLVNPWVTGQQYAFVNLFLEHKPGRGSLLTLS